MYNAIRNIGLGLVVAWGLLAAPVQAQESVYYRNFVRHADGTACNHAGPEAAFTVYLNGDDGEVLLDNAPRWEDGEANIPGQGRFGIELANFPTLTVGDTVHVRFTCLARQEQGTLVEAVADIPWNRLPLRLELAAAPGLPAPPQHVTMAAPDAEHRVVSWTQEPGLTYDVYRRTLQDTLAEGRSRMLYTLVTEGLTGGSFTDAVPEPAHDYAYVVYAVAADGQVSAHAPEAILTEHLEGLTVEAGATNAHLSWSTYVPPVRRTVGYNIYRGTEGGSLTLLTHTTDTTYTDTRLTPGTTYTYQVRARADAETETGRSEEVAVTPQGDPADYYTYASLKTAVVVYHNTNLGQIPTAELEKIKRQLDVARLFYWRNSGMKFNLEFTYYPVEGYRELSGEFDLPQVASELAAQGVMDGQYDLVYRIWPAQNGYWSIGATDGLPLPGPSERRTGFSQTQWPCGTGVVYPGHEAGIDYCNTWVFIHEAQHAIDDIYRVNGHPEMAHGDIPWAFEAPTGEHLHFQAGVFRAFDAYEDLLPAWGDGYEAPDADGDGFPDVDPRVPLDELRFGSDPTSPDTDGDGYTDRQEAIDGTYGGSDPTDPDTDHDGLADGDDPFPRYPVRQRVAPFTPTIDGVVEEGWTLVNDSVSYTQQGYAPRLYMSYDSDKLYLALELDQVGIPTFFFDFDTNGWWHGAGNTEMAVDLSRNGFNQFRTWDASPEVQRYSDTNPNDLYTGPGLWDTSGDYQQTFQRRVFTPASVDLQVKLDLPRIRLEMAIPRNELAGLTLQPGDSVGVNVRYGKVNNQPVQWANTFDQYSFMYFKLAGSPVATEPTPELGPEALHLAPGYPNPFTSQTHLTYTLPEEGQVELAVYNVLGQRVRTLVSGVRPAGTYTATWDGTSEAGAPVAGGLYFGRLTVDGGAVRQVKMLRVH